MTIDTARTIGMLGIGGAGMRAIAYVLAGQGKHIFGSDRNLLASDPELNFARLVAEDELAARIGECDVLIYSDATEAAHRVRVSANQAARPTLAYHQALAELTRGKNVVAVAGTHGKSSTTAMLAHILVAAGRDPTVVLGAAIPAWGDHHARTGSSTLWVVEADEYRNHFLALHPAAAVITTIAWDHPDFFKDFSDVAAAFGDFLKRIHPSGSIITSDTTYAATSSRVEWPARTRAIHVSKVKMPKLPIPGAHMRHNAALAVAQAHALGLDSKAAAASLASWAGLRRRFERLGTFAEHVVIYSDYGHHPTELAATITAADQLLTGQRLLILFEPHTQARFSAFFEDYRAALTDPKHAVLICPVYQARTDARAAEHGQRDSRELYELLRQGSKDVWHLDSLEQLPSWLREHHEPFDAAIAFSAGALDGALRSIIH